MNPGRAPMAVPRWTAAVGFSLLALIGMAVEAGRRETRRWEARLASSDPATRARAIDEARDLGEVHRVERRLVELALADEEPRFVVDAALAALASRGSLCAARLLREEDRRWRREALAGCEDPETTALIRDVRTEVSETAQLIEERHARAATSWLPSSWTP